MHNNYYFLRQLVPELMKEIEGTALWEAFSQHKDELILGFTSSSEHQFYIKADLSSGFSCLSFSTEYARAKKNSVDLFNGLIGQRVIDGAMYKNERAFSIAFESGEKLLFKLFGNQSNILLVNDQEVVSDIFKKNMTQDWELNISGLDRDLTQNEDFFNRAEDGIHACFPTFGKPVLAYIQQEYAENKGWQQVSEVLELLEEPKYYICLWNQKHLLSLVPIGDQLEKFNNPIEAVNSFYIIYKTSSTLLNAKKSLLSNLTKQKLKATNYLKKTKSKKEAFINKQDDKQIADVIMANMHQIKQGSKEVSLFNFYTNEEVVIPLKEQLSPQKNAERLYRKSKNKDLELKQLNENIKVVSDKLSTIEDQLNQIKAIDDFKSLKQFIKQHNLKETRKDKEEEYRFKETVFEGFRILVGRNARNNDELTQQFAHKEDLWLHAKDVSGSHVIIKYQSGKTFPKSVVHRAATIAAFYSKRKNDSICPVIYTPKKFVRKVKGAPAGAVMVDKEEVLMVVPSDI